MAVRVMGSFDFVWNIKRPYASNGIQNKVYFKK